MSCMLIDGVVKRYPTAVVEFDTPYYTGTANVLYMETRVQDIIIGNISGARGVESIFEIRQVRTAKLTGVDTTQVEKWINLNIN